MATEEHERTFIYILFSRRSASSAVIKSPQYWSNSFCGSISIVEKTP